MKIEFKKKKNYLYLGLGILWLILGGVNFFGENEIRWTDYGYILAGCLYIGQYLWDFKNSYLIVENGFIKKNSILGKKINLNEIIWIKKFAGDYTLKTEKEELKINTELIEEKSLSELNELLDKLNLPSDKTPFRELKN
jgi:hypothetical protein